MGLFFLKIPTLLFPVSYANPSASCQTRSEEAAVGGSVPGHQPGPVERLAEFVHSLVYGSPGFTDVHEEVLGDWPDAVEAGGFWGGGGYVGEWRARRDPACRNL